MNRSLGVRGRRLLPLGLLLVALVPGVWSRAAPAQAGKVSLSALVRETQKSSDKTNELRVVWWIPEEY